MVVHVIAENFEFSELEKMLQNLRVWGQFEGVSLAGRRIPWTTTESLSPDNDQGIFCLDGRYQGRQIKLFAGGTSTKLIHGPDFFEERIQNGKTFLTIDSNIIESRDLLDKLLNGVERPELYLVETERQPLPEDAEIRWGPDGIKKIKLEETVKDASIYKSELNSFIAKTRELMFNEDRKDTAFRYMLFAEQTEAIIKEHERTDNLSKKGAKLYYGQAFIQLMGLMQAHQINPYYALRQVWDSEKVHMNEIVDIYEVACRYLGKQGIQTFEHALQEYQKNVFKIARFLTHHPRENKDARPVGNQTEEEKLYGETLLNLFGLMHLKDIDPVKAIQEGYQNWEDADWRKTKIDFSLEGYLFGLVVNPGNISGQAYVIDENNPAANFPSGAIVISRYNHLDSAIDILRQDRYVGAYLTENGGRTAHASVLLREEKFPVVVGIKDITSKIKTGDQIEIRAPCEELTGKDHWGYVKKI